MEIFIGDVQFCLDADDQITREQMFIWIFMNIDDAKI